MDNKTVKIINENNTLIYDNGEWRKITEEEKEDFWFNN